MKIKMNKGFTLIEALILLAIFVLLIVVAFSTNKRPQVYSTKPENNIVIENCQYIVNKTHNGYSVLTHKGNCTNVIHRIINPEKN